MENKEKPFIHQNALCETKRVGTGTRIWGGAHILKGASIGANCNVGEGVFIENDVSIGNSCTIKNGIALWDKVEIEDGVFLGPYVVFTNELKPRAFIKKGAEGLLPTLIQRGATIGANATIVCGITIGEFAMIGAGSVVIEDVKPHQLVVGNPGRVIGTVCFCGEKMETNVIPKECSHGWQEKVRATFQK